MKNWNQLFIRHGFMVEEIRPNVFESLRETEENVAFLIESFEKLSISFVLEKGLLSVTSPVIAEEIWLAYVDFKYRGRGEGLWFRPGLDQPKVRELDTYIAGMVRQLNRLGFYTNSCCDGHEKRSPSIGFTNEVDMEKVIEVLIAAGVPRILTRNRVISLNISRKLLLDITEKLSAIQQDWLEKGIVFIRKQLFLIQLEQLLSIAGESGNESKVRQYIIEKLRYHVDYMTVDNTGNLLAQKTYGNGHGPTILLNAHMDTVDRIEPDRTIVKNGEIWSSDHGILGADDRAGVAVLLEMAQRLQSSGFNGRVKFIFTVEEEIGLIGARSIDETFLWDVDAAIVVDRRGTGDIVTSCGGYQRFCHENYGNFFEEAAKQIGLLCWKTTIGGSSDTRIWAEHGIQSVNLSAGYRNEHTEFETLDVEACYNTVSLITKVFNEARNLQRTFRKIEILENVRSEVR
ncbi:M20/M25/M40 family metallo-hydrolase [Bacillus sp. ISL-40]|uniref:M20/M25/M40 family metallo-hydrolase n=1 Tax=unclassified Bacillus (in: firmicutes) TaxID=185979 RepID=UPI001BE71962|nr:MULTISPECIES: M20/M25/M40 family metallo-hydrolase [unclassified Bacillus (in: firmicutes)]MBT2696185.1 M20/M25/M40 family metallo-hydrolase [Bacillus sp. ISL-40]MBT2720340.1 M20/M25/M40 family metallo-hydrolase [Bacillus sp. ISL-46]MBT2743033.1 M20/M25/M40 family metallo-hydrolase [Bacillus sp. ISL-77]